MSVFATLVEHLADLMEPLFQASATAAAIILFTALVRLAVHPLSRAAARGQKANARLAPRVAELRKKHGKNPEKMKQALMELYAKEKASPLSGCLPSLLQLPAFFLLYHLFSNSSIGGEPNGLLGHTLFAAPLGDRWGDALANGGVLGGAGAVYLGLFVIVTGVAVFNYRRTKRQMAANPMPKPDPDTPGMGTMAAMAKVMPLMSFATLVTVAVVPLAAALYIVTSTTWSAIERAYLYRDMPTAGALASPL
ncbi:YidC/Oxa1 family membrane protein insertase [Streptomyces sp. NPDC004726]